MLNDFADLLLDDVELLFTFALSELDPDDEIFRECGRRTGAAVRGQRDHAEVGRVYKFQSSALKLANMKSFQPLSEFGWLIVVDHRTCSLVAALLKDAFAWYVTRRRIAIGTNP